MNLRNLAFLSFALVLCLFAIACSDDDDPSPSATAAANATPPLPTTVVGQPAPTPTIPANVCEPNPAPAATGRQPADFGFRELTAPKSGDTVRSPLTISGRQNVFEGRYGIQIRDARGRIIAEQRYDNDNLRLTFSVQLPFTVVSPTPACVWVFDPSGRDGSPVNVTQVPVLLQP